MKKKPIFLLILLATVAGILIFRNLFFTQTSNGEIILYGNVDIRKVDLGFRVGGRILSMEVEEGDRVKKGQKLAQLDDIPFQDELSLALAKRSQATAVLAKMEAGSRPQEIAQAEALVREREATVANLQTEFKRIEKLIATGAVSQQAYDNAETSLKESRARLITAKQSLNLAREGYRSEDIAAARADLQAAKAQLASSRTRLADTVINAQEEGTILTRVEEPGAVVAAGQTVVTLSLENPIWIRAYVDEPDLGRVYSGMHAVIYTDSYPDRTYKGHIGFISPEAEFTPKSVQTEELRSRLVYQLRIIADDPDHGLRQGMPVTVRLFEKDKHQPTE